LLVLTHIILVRGVLSGLVGQVSCTQEVAATPLLDLQSAKFKGYFPGLVQVIIRDYLAADALKPHYGAGTPTVVAVREGFLAPFGDEKDHHLPRQAWDKHSENWRNKVLRR
jgi:hypothetical protein